MNNFPPARTGIVAIGRNEGERLKACLRSLPPDAAIVYVDSGSTDDSVAFAEGVGATVVRLAVPPNFTAARARNAGLEALLAAAPEIETVQMVDGDCEVDGDWLRVAHEALAIEPDLAAVFGRRRERFPDASVYNRLCDDEWNVPVGEARSCGGDALFRVAALKAVGGYNPAIIAGEEPDMCLRLRLRHWRIRRIDAEMTRHDAAMTRFGQWWQRSKRSGHAFAELLHRHGEKADPRWRAQVKSIVLWAGVFPALILLSLLTALAAPAMLIAAALLLLLYPAQVARLALKAGPGDPFAWKRAFFLTLGKFPQLTGILRYHRNRRAARASTLIEYKGAA
jgi:GT2 family glycosyltransferase